MYHVNKEKNDISKVEELRFSDLGIKEKEHLQEWLAKNPECLGEELLIIGKEVSEFDGTNERIDLLAIDKCGSLVVIENKLGSKKDVVWQVIKYSAYCSTLTKAQILEIFQDYLKDQGSNEAAEDVLVEFFGENVSDIKDIELNKDKTQKVFIVASNLRPEVTSTALWLLEYGIRIKCFKLTLFRTAESPLLSIEQAIPTKENPIIKRKERNREEKNKETLDMEEREKFNEEFWREFLRKIKSKDSSYSHRNPAKASAYYISTGISGVGYRLVVSGSEPRVEFYMNNRSHRRNKKAFDFLMKNKEEIASEAAYEINELSWERRDEKKASIIKKHGTSSNLNFSNKDDWDNIISFLIENLTKFESVFGKKISELKTNVYK